MDSSKKSQADDASTVLTWNIAVGRDRGDQTSAANLDDQLLQVTVWANRTLRDDGGRGDDKDGGAGYGEFTTAYDLVYSTTVHGDPTADEQLYGRLRACVAHHLNDVVAPALERAAGGVELLAVARRVYTDYERSTGRLSDACAYLDAVMRRRGREVEPVRTMVRTAFRDMLLRRCDAQWSEIGIRQPDGPTGNDDLEIHDDLLARLEDAVVQSADVHLYSGYECADASFCGRTVLAAVADSATPMGLGDTLARRLCERFLDKADRRLLAFVRTAIKTFTVDAYAEAAALTIDAEAAVALRYGGPVAARAVEARASMLLVAERRAFVVHSDTGLCRMMDAGREASAVAKVYELLARLPDAAGPRVVADAVACFACRRLHSTSDSHHDDHLDDFMRRIMRFQDAMDEYLRHAFADDPVVARMVEHQVRRAINCLEEVGRHMARYISDLLCEPELPVASPSLDRAFDLVRYLSDSELDKFEHYYRYNLALRLAIINHTWPTDYVDDGREEMAFEMFVSSCGRQRARTLRLLLDDVRASRAFKGLHAGNGRARSWPVDLDVIVVNRHVWPLMTRPSSFHYPPCAQTAFRLYREVYVTAHDGRCSLTYLPQMCTAQMMAGRRGHHRVQLTVTMYQAAVLLLFNGPVPLASHTYLADATQLPEPELRHALESLVRHGVLLQTNRGGTVYVLHQDYKHHRDGGVECALRQDDAQVGNDCKTPLQTDYYRLNLLQ